MVTERAAAKRRTGTIIAMVLLVVLLALISLGVGPVRMSPLEVLDTLFGGGSDVYRVIVQEIRLPRTILAVAIGGILGLSGAALQGLLRNPLASPSLFGAPQAAAAAAAAIMAFGFANALSLAVPLGGIVGAMLSVGAYTFSQDGAQDQTQTQATVGARYQF